VSRVYLKTDVLVTEKGSEDDGREGLRNVGFGSTLTRLNVRETFSEI
jgi:hypothetical protein